MLRYFVGRSGSGKTYGIYTEIKKFIEKDVQGKILLIVPEQFTLESEYDLIDKMGLEGLLNVEILSFSRLMDRVFEETGIPPAKEINHLGKTMLLKRIFDDNKDQLSIFSGIYNQNGFISLFSDLIGELKRSGLDEKGLEEINGRIEGDAVLTSKLSDIAQVYKEFVQRAGALYMDDEDKFNFFIEKIKDSTLISSSHIYIDGFNGFTFQEIRILEEIMKCAKSMAVTFIYDEDEDTNLFIPSIRNMNSLGDIAKKWGIEEKTKAFNYTSSNHQLSHLQDNFYRFPYKIYSAKPDGIGIEVFGSPEEEIERVAGEICRLVREEGLKWKDVGVVCGDIEGYGQIIKRVFREYDIPYFIDSKRTIMNSPIVKVILSSLKAVTSGYKYENVFKLAKTGFAGLTFTEAQKLENYVLAHGIIGRKWHVPIDIEKYGEEIENSRRVLIEPLNRLKESLKKSYSLKEITASLLTYADELKLFEKLGETIDMFKREEKLEYANEYSQIWNIIIDVLEQATEIIGDEKMTVKEFTDMIEAGFREFKIGIIPPTMDKVLIGTVERTKSHRVDSMFIVGMNEGLIPSNRSDYGILVDEDKIKMIGEGALIKSDLRTIEEDEELAFYSVLSRAGRRISFSYPIGDNEGKTLRPSIYMDRIRKIMPFTNEKSYVVSGLPMEQRITNQGSTMKYMIEAFRSWIESGHIDERWFEVFRLYHDMESTYELDQILGGLFHTNQIKSIGKENAAKLYNLPLRSSVSRIEKYMTCPFSHFVKYGLKPADRDEYEIKLPDIGIIFHESIEKFSKELFKYKSDLTQLTKEKSDSIIEGIIDNMTTEYGNKVFESSYRYKYLVNKIKRVGRRSAWTIVNHINSGKFEPTAYEIKFGDDEQNSIPPFIIELPNGEKIFLEGRIDRIDILNSDDKSYAKIIDYKSGAKSFSFSDAYNGLEIQLLVYMDAILENSDYFKVDKLYPGGAFYFRIDDPVINGDAIEIADIEKEIMKSLKLDGVVVKDVKVVSSIDSSILETGDSMILPVDFKKDGDFSSTSKAIEEKEFIGLIDHVKQIVVEAGTEILDGNVEVLPIREGSRVACDRCDYKGVCQFDTRFEDNKYKALKKYSKKEVLEILNKSDDADSIDDSEFNEGEADK